MAKVIGPGIHVVVRGRGGVDVKLRPGDPVPRWAAKQVGPHCLEGYDPDVPDDEQDETGPAETGPADPGKGNDAPPAEGETAPPV